MTEIYANHHMTVSYDDGDTSLRWVCLHDLDENGFCSEVEGINAVGSNWFLDRDIDYFDGTEFASGYVYLWWETDTDWETGLVDGEVLFDYAETDPKLVILRDSDIEDANIDGLPLVMLTSARISAWSGYRVVTDNYTQDIDSGKRTPQIENGRKVHRVTRRKDGINTIKFSINGKSLPSSYILEPGSVVILGRE